MNYIFGLTNLIDFYKLVLQSIILYFLLILTCLITVILLRKNRYLSVYKKVEKIAHINYNSKYLIFTVVTIFLIFAVIQLWCSITFKDSHITITMLSIINLFLYMIANIILISRQIKLTKTRQKLQYNMEYTKNLENLYDSVRSFKHDFYNIIQNISGYITNDDFEGLKRYYTDLYPECKNINNLSILNPNQINNPAVYSLLSNKYIESTSHGITVNLEFSLNLSDFNLSIFDFTRTLGILLDNAIEACKECEEKIINIIFRTSMNSRTHYVTIENTYCNFDVDLDKIFEKDYSSKAGNTGIGLWKVNNIINKHDHVFLNTSKNDKFFKQELQILF